MIYSTEAATTVLKMAKEALDRPESAPVRLQKLWWTLLFSRARALTASVRQLTGDKVAGGPFKDMKLIQEVSTIYPSPMLLGCYEHELHPVFEKAIAGNYQRILNIGCSLGYYAVGLARRMPHVIVEAFDIDPEARRKCADLARLNNVEDRVKIGGQFYGDDFSTYRDEKTLVLMDIEGAETSLLDPARYPALQKFDVIVELHDMIDATTSQKICERFVGSHTVELIKNVNFLPDLSAVLAADAYIDPFDQLLLGWEGRDGSTPWGIFYAK